MLSVPVVDSALIIVIITIIIISQVLWNSQESA